MPFLADQIVRFRKNMQDTILPFWSTVGFQPDRRMFCESMTFSGTPNLYVPHRAMVQARQIFVFSHAARSNVYPVGGELALQALDSLQRHFSNHGDLTQGLAFSISIADGSVLAS